MHHFDTINEAERPLKPSSSISEPPSAQKHPLSASIPENEPDDQDVDLDDRHQYDVGGVGSHSPSLHSNVQPLNDPLVTFANDTQPLISDSGDEEPATAACFERSTSPTSALHRNRGAEYQKAGEEGICKMHHFSLYETTSRFYLVGGDVLDRKFRILKIDRTADSDELVVAEDEIVYTRKETNQLLNAIDDGNKASGGLKLRCSGWGLLGFIRFTGAYYMLLVTKRSQVAMVGGHNIYQIDGTDLVPLTTSASSRMKAEKVSEEARFVSTLNNLDLSRSFYFSYTYDITRSLQQNLMQEREALGQGKLRKSHDFHDGMFVWNHHLLEPASKVFQNTYDWCMPGFVANDVETEQIVSEALTTSFHAPGPQLYANPTLTSYVQHRGSIPLHWTQDNSGVSPKPDIELNLVDPFFTAAALHFDNLFERYGAPARERTPRESILLKEYTNAISYLNQALPEGKKILYKAWDMSRASKSRDQDVIGILETTAKNIVTQTGFFRNGDDVYWKSRTQNGVARTNCIDCLDRTNAAQFVIGKCALAHQLQALGIIADETIEFGTDMVSALSHMYHAHGDMIAIQYGGSHLVNTMATYRKINQWSSHSRDMVESFKRYYNNSFLDRQRQEAYNLFLGNYIYIYGQPMLWDLATDYYLHHADPRAWLDRKRQDYVKWFDPQHLEERKMPPIVRPMGNLADKSLEFFDDYWLEYYRPHLMSSLLKLFPYKANSLRKFPPTKEGQDGVSEPAAIETTPIDRDMLGKMGSKKAVTIAAPPDPIDMESQREEHKPSTTLSDWLHLQTVQHPQPEPTKTASKDELNRSSGPKPERTPKDKSAMTQWTLNQFVVNSLNPSVVEAEADEYLRYINHPLNLPFVVSTNDPPHPNSEFLAYVQSNAPGAVTHMQSAEDDIADFKEFLDVGDDPLTVTEADTPKKRYKAYRQWLKGRSLFKQQRADV
ncbi:MAG: hypothetical protein Q9218_003290 [Villophora microphyllina]